VYARITILLAIIFGASTAATAYYYYAIPHPSQLRILYTHSPEMVDEIVNGPYGFKTWYQEKYGQQVEVTITKTSFQTAYEKAKAYATDPEADIWWGGPLSLFQDAIAGLLQYNSTYKDEINVTYRLHQMDNRSTPYWYAASQYGLGIMYNDYVLDALNLTVPQTWTDLLDQKYIGNIAMTEAANSKFTLPFIMLTLQNMMQITNGAQNWTAGWEYLVKIAESIKEYDNNEGDTALKVSSGYIPLAIVPDFYAYDKMAIPVPDINFTYLDATLLQPDPIAIFKQGEYPSEAKAFIDFITTQQAQNIIGKYLLPIRKDATVVSPRVNPFDLNFPFVASHNETFEGNTILLVTSMGNIIIELYNDMPITSENFKNLTEHGIYDGTIFHRVVHDFVIQGGDASTKGISVPTIPDELPNKHSNVRGSMAMAKTSAPNSATSQFYINLKDNLDLDSNYSVFGRVIEGMKVVDAIGNVTTDSNDKPLQDVTLIIAVIIG
jgi:peptidylprolyl isomerase